MRVVVTGATGNLGTALVERLALDPKVESVLGVARHLPAEPTPGVEFVAADTTRDPLRELFDGADAVVHCAWTFQPTHDPQRTWENNVRGAERVFGATAACGAAALVHISSVGAYRSREGPEPVDESWPTDALCTAAYGREKSYLERVLDHVACRHPALRVVRLRPAFLFQRASAPSQWQLFAGSLLPPGLLRARIPLVPLPSPLHVQVLHSDDAAEAVRLALHEPVHGAFNLAAGQPLSGQDLADALGARALAVPSAVVRAVVATAWRVRAVPTSPHLMDLFLGLPVMDASRARAELGWRPATSPSDALCELLEGLRSADGASPSPLAEDPGARRRATAR